MATKAIALMSGGLDSILAAKVVQEQGIEVAGVCFVMSFASRDVEAFRARVKEACDSASIPVKFVDISNEFLEIVKKPAHGVGSHLNPCIDCKIYMLSRAKKMMEETGASFVVTGEVRGERPMSQNKQSLDVIEKRSGLKGFLLRPLSAKLLEETILEKEGLVDRNKLLDLGGRGRTRQFELAKKYEITKYFTPAGGCLLTDPGFSKRLKDLMANDGLKLDEIQLLKFGRHFRLANDTKVVVGRDEKDNDGIMAVKKEKDVLFHIKDKSGPYALLRGKADAGNIEKAAALCVSHSKSKANVSEEVECWTNATDKKTIKVSPMTKEEIEVFRV